LGAALERDRKYFGESITISAPSSGQIESLAVQKGDVVEQGIRLYTLDVDTATKVGDVQQMIDEVLIAEREMLTRRP
jgi:multidrug efflux pump subunit AcrA (membrane-fusion protein)